MKTRSGFTLLELITTVIVVGLLATIALSRLWGAKDRAHSAAMMSDLRTVAVQQERYFGTNMTYANDPVELPDFAISPGVVITITWTAPDGWAGTATHVGLTGHQCGYFTGPAPAGAASPATVSGQVSCD